MSAFAVEELCRPSSGMSCDGFWSGTEERQHQPYIAMIPESRYLDQSEIIDQILHEDFPTPKPYVPKSYPPPRTGLSPLVPFQPKVRRETEGKPLPQRRDTVWVGDIEVPARMSGWPYKYIEAWSNAEGHKDLQDAIVALWERGV